MLQNYKKRLGYDLIVRKTQLPSKNMTAHIFYFYVFEKEELQTYFEHIGPVRI